MTRPRWPRRWRTSAAPAPGWTRLSHSTIDRKRHLKITLLHSKRSFAWVVLWVSRAPASSIGTAQEPGHVSINELELFPAG